MSGVARAICTGFETQESLSFCGRKTLILLFALLPPEVMEELSASSRIIKIGTDWFLFKTLWCSTCCIRNAFMYASYSTRRFSSLFVINVFIWGRLRCVVKLPLLFTSLLLQSTTIWKKWCYIFLMRFIRKFNREKEISINNL